MKVCYLLARYVSHRKAGLNYHRCFQSLGVKLVFAPDQADVVIIHDEPWTYSSYFRAFPCLRSKYVIAYAVWEADRVPIEYEVALNLVDEVWTASTYCENIFNKVRDRVFVVPHVAEAAVADENALEAVRRRLSYDRDLFYFYTITNPVDVRKNLGAAIRAYARVLDSRARFVIKVNGGLTNEEIGIKSAIVINEFIAEEEIQALHQLGQCFVSAHCSEGWGMGLSESMASGNLAIATGYGGNTDFMLPTNSLLVEFQVESIRQEDWTSRPHYWSPHMRWAYVDENDLTRKLRFALACAPAVQRLRDQAKNDMRQYSVQVVAQVLGRRLEALL